MKFPNGEVVEITDHDDKAVADLVQAFMHERYLVSKMCAETRKTNSFLETIAIGGAELRMPWHRLPPVRRLQVEAVRDRLREKKAHNILRAAIQVFTPVQNGYSSAAALAKYCYSINIFRFV